MSDTSRMEDRRLRIAIFYPLSSILVLSMGCSRLVPVEGKITLDGQPLKGAMITFFPQETSDEKIGGPHQANTMSDKDGHFKLDTVNRPGALPGTYRVTISRRALPPGVKPPQDDSVEEKFRAAAQSVEIVPKVYTQRQMTPLEIEVPKGGTKDIVIDLHSQQS